MFRVKNLTEPYVLGELFTEIPVHDYNTRQRMNSMCLLLRGIIYKEQLVIKV